MQATATMGGRPVDRQDLIVFAVLIGIPLAFALGLAVRAWWQRPILDALREVRDALKPGAPRT